MPSPARPDRNDRHKLRLCIVCQRYQFSREYLPQHAALEREFEVTHWFVDDGWPVDIRDLPDYQAYDAVLWFVRFRELILRPPFDWADFRGMRLMYDQDAYQNFSTMAGDRYLNAWPGVYEKQGFQALLCTGEAVRDNLSQFGVNAIWVPKAYDPERFRDLGRQRAGICYFGELYDARAAMLRHLKRHGVPVERFRCSFFELNDYLNRFAMCVICNMVSRRPDVPAIVARLLPAVFPAEMQAGPEAMLKNFEVAATGCVPVCDFIPELPKLGFVDGETMISYQTFDDLVEKLEWYLERPEAVDRISRAAARLCADRHTWDHRARQIADIIVQAQAATPVATA